MNSQKYKYNKMQTNILEKKPNINLRKTIDINE